MPHNFKRLQLVRDWESLARTCHFNSKAVARACCISQRTLERHFLKAFRTSPQLWFATLQMREAAVLLQRPDITVKETAYTLGFKSPNHFGKSFKKHYGQCPSGFHFNARITELETP
jgi:AraC family transcriptional regulator, activator of mtrCDE